MERATGRIKREEPKPTQKGLSISLKIGGIIIAVALLLGLVVVINLFTSVQAGLTAEMEKRGKALGTALATSAANPILTVSTDVLKRLAKDQLKEESVTYALIADEEGKILAHSYDGEVPPELLSSTKGMEKKILGTHLLEGGKTVHISAPVVDGLVGNVHLGLSTERIESEVYTMLYRVLAFILVAGLVIVVLGTMYANNVLVTPIKQIASVAESVGHGDLSREVEVKTEDEIGHLGETFNETIRRLRGLLQTEEERNRMQRQVMDLLTVVSSAAEGDLTKEAEVTADALGSLADAFNLMVGGLAGLVEQVRGASLEIDNAARTILVSSESLRRGAEDQGVQITGAAQSVHTMSSSMQRVAEDAELASDASRQATESAVKGEKAVEETIRGMQRIRGTVQLTSKKVKALGDRSLEIGAIVEVINDIATQTNLLALNAAIEAARAGEHGRGFAVVADEVRKLAERSTKATKDIGGLIKGIQVETNEVVTTMEEGTREVEEGTRIADSAGAALKEIESIVKRSSTLVAEISQAARQQVKATDAVVRTMESISGVSRQAGEGVKHTVATIKGLADLSDRLVSTIGKFKIVREAEERSLSAAMARDEEEIRLS
jgi:methyl-accepting chemotaxis protein